MRERLIRKLEVRLKKKQPVIRKSKYLLWESQGKIAGIDRNQIEEDKKYDGLKGYITNGEDTTAASDVIDQYHNLWKLEKAFRMSKSDLRERPVYHRKLDRIKSHLIICFVSLLTLKEAEAILRKIHYSLEKAMEILGEIGQGKIRIGNIILDIDSELTDEAPEVMKLFEGH